MVNSRFLKPWWLVLYALVFFLLLRPLVLPTSQDLDTTFRLAPNATMQSFYEHIELWVVAEFRMKRFMKQHADETRGIQPWSYVFSWSYTSSEILDVFLAGPQQVYEHITLLEWWSMYDMDAYLVGEGLIEAGEYIAFVTDSEIIWRYIQRYDFLAQAQKDRGQLISLEGYLYPNTYFVDRDKNVVDQLVYLQLEAFKTTIWTPFGDWLMQLSTTLQEKWYDFTLSTYGALTLASIIEKEERYGPNRVTIASVFYNRLTTNMRIDADISLCYGLQTWYESCTPAVIWRSVQDASNPYNTRAVSWLPPTPIASPTVSSVQALLDANKTGDFYYLHDSSWQLHTATTLDNHVSNKQKYLY
jgi:UPF0755 protein